MSSASRIGIIDIGSNSIRLVIYGRTESSAFQVIDESKHSARLSELVSRNNNMDATKLEPIIERLNHFKHICAANHVEFIRAVATAAIRNAANRHEIIDLLERQTGLSIEILSGEQEAYYGFLGMANTIDIEEGYLVDIGGGSTEVTFFQNRNIVHSVSFPFGCVNTFQRFGEHDPLSGDEVKQIQLMVKHAVEREPWIGKTAGLPMIGLGGTTRTVGKMVQKRTKYPLNRIHNYRLETEQVDGMLQTLRDSPLSQRRNTPGLSKDRADLIVPGMIILQTLYQLSGCSCYIISGSGIRDGLFYETVSPDRPLVPSVLESSLHNMTALYLPAIPKQHTEHVHMLVMQLFGVLGECTQMSERDALYIHISSLLYRIGTSIDYYGYSGHTFYMIMNARLNGLTHRELILCAMIASYKTRSRARQICSEYKDIIKESDYERVCRLGTMLQLAIALDKSETQTLKQVSFEIHKKKLIIWAQQHHGIFIEQMQVKSIAKEFKKVWEMTPELKTGKI